MSNFKVKNGLNLPTGTPAAQGDVVVESTAGLQAYHNSAVRTYVDTNSTQTLTNKTLTQPTLTVQDSTFTIQDNGDNTKQAQFQASGITAGQTRTLTIPDASTTIVGTDTTQTLSNKTLADPVTTGQIKTANGTGSAPAFVASGDTATGLYWNGAQTLQFVAGTSGNQPWSVDNNGMNLHNQKRARFYDFGGSLQTCDISAPTTFSASYTMKLPTAQGAANTLLKNDGSGNLSFATLVNADVSSSAAITRSKLADGTAYRILANNSSGVISENAAITASRAVASDANGQLVASATTATELGYVSGVTSAIQTQLDGKTGITAVTAAKTTTYTATTSDVYIPVSASGGSWTLTLYAASGNSGRTLTIIRTDQTLANAVTIDGNASETINGATTIKLQTQYECVVLLCDGSNWHIIERRVPSSWTSFTPSSYTGLGTPSGVNFWWKRNGSNAEIRGYLTCGTTTATGASINIPTGLTVDSTFLDASTRVHVFGYWTKGTGSFTEIFNASGGAGVVTNDYSQTGRIAFDYRTSDNTAGANDNASTIASSGQELFFNFSVPISGWEG